MVHSLRARISASLLLAAASLTVPAVTIAAETAADYRQLLAAEGPDRVVEAVLEAYGGEQASGAIERLADTVASSPSAAAAVLDALSAERSVEAATIGAELMVAINGRLGGDVLAASSDWGPIVGRASTWLTHNDPFVRGIAAWALTGVRNASRSTVITAETPAWITSCRQLAPESCVESDFILQAFALGDHRTSGSLAKSAGQVVERARSVARYAQERGDEAQRQRAKAAMEALLEIADRPTEERPFENLTDCRQWWLDVRQAARNVVLASPDLRAEQFVLFKVPPRVEGNHPDCLVQNHGRPKERRPGGDLYVQSGVEPNAPQRALIGDQLGPGHVQDMDLWWDADRLVFSYVRQPAWGRSDFGWGHVEWRNGADLTAFDHVVGFQDGFFWENGSQPTHLYEIRLDGTDLRELTNDPLYCDREPAYLPDGDVVFSSDRGCGASQCGAAPLAYSDFGLPNLFRVSPDTRAVQRLTYNKDVDRYPHCLNNGLIGYMRWDYQERFWQWPHALWTISPDGTMNDGLFKVHFNDPQSVREPRSIPGSEQLVVIACGHHAPPEGAVAVVDPSRGVNNPSAMRYVTPACSPLEGGLGDSPTVEQGGVRDAGGLYMTPWPLSEQGFLVSYAVDLPGASAYAAYYIDVWGNKELIHRDATMDVMCPMPVLPRPKPPIRPSQIDSNLDYALCYLDDVNRDMPGVAPGTVRYIRISEHLQWYFNKHDKTGSIRWPPGTQHSRNFGYWTWSPTRVIGTVPVEEDGSAYFKVPAGLAIYFQALDENLMEVRRMRSHIEFKPGEFRGCVGCHETKQHVPKFNHLAQRLALGRAPSHPTPPPWGNTSILDYEQLIQPIFDRHCVSCHAPGDADTDLDLTAARDPHGFVQSYRSLLGIKRDEPTPLGEGYREAYTAIPLLEKDEGDRYEALKSRIYQPGGLLCLSNHMGGPEVTQPRQFGSHQSRLVLILLNDEVHRREVALSKDEWETLVTWVDANAPYHATYFQYFDTDGNLLPEPLRVRIDLDPPFQVGEKSQEIVADRRSPPS